MGGGKRKGRSPEAGGSTEGKLPQKKFYRARAHSNPLNDSHFPVPLSPTYVPWSAHFPAFFPSTPVPAVPLPASCSTPTSSPAPTAASSSGVPVEPPAVRFADVGCGFGGLLVKLAPLYPDTLMLGMELRDKVSEYVRERIGALRVAHPGQYGNVSVMRSNAMKYLPNLFVKGQLTKMFFLFPDPHFKEKNHRRRIITHALLAEYAYCLAPGGRLYTITDVAELGEWMRTTLEQHPLFQPLTPEELAADPVVALLDTSSEEGQKVERNQGQTHRAIFKRVAYSD
ncbi:tRNA methyltransferase [Klebsormidium nitens]|uniref:tRNA (guanine-N(7)-)-methyltransferase n=1 Tax=Klebsormidium nitens TaxID=105231 RepID=A0A1Y1IFR2_KLENI|nr:tRNA methyltransferase [Klebsormidium nitens]|eukprot:GAQ88882.1 tRNA methyltransferase [Klebsormidium nitens]